MSDTESINANYSANASFLLGQAFCIIHQMRFYLINKEDVEGVKLIEDAYQTLLNKINQLYYVDKDAL